MSPPPQATNQGRHQYMSQESNRHAHLHFGTTVVKLEHHATSLHCIHSEQLCALFRLSQCISLDLGASFGVVCHTGPLLQIPQLVEARFHPTMVMILES
eukprot:COSAG01_NODE_1225_length_11135_cov_32.660750_1_plen_99_part_00